MTFSMNQSVTIRAGLSRKKVGTGVVKKVSPAGKRITVVWNNFTYSFYRNSDNTRYVKDPGAGIFGNMLNDYIAIPKENGNGTEAA